MGSFNVAWREIASGTSFMVQFFMFSIMLWFMVDRMKKVGIRYGDDLIRFAIALSVYLLGAFLSRGGTWMVFLTGTRSAHIAGIDKIQVVGMFIMIVGGACFMKVASKDSWGHVVWMLATLTALAVPVIVHYL